LQPIKQGIKIQEQQAALPPPPSSSSSLLLRQTKPVSYAFTYLNSPDTQRQYPKRLKLFFDHVGLPGKNLEEQGQAFLDKARENQQWAEENILLFLNFHKQRVLRKEIAAGTLKNFYRPIKTFYDAHDDLLSTLNWKRISRALPRAKSSSNDRAPTIEEIRKLVEYSTDRRIKPIVYTMCSSGIRLGAWDYLRWKHVFPIMNDNGEVLAAKMIIYAGEADEYYTFITPEAYNALKDWIEFRASYGEKITGESWVMRNKWQTADVKRREEEEEEKGGGGGRVGLVTHPKKLPSTAIKKILIRALYTQGIRRALPEGVRRHEWKGAHGFRKFFETRAMQVMSFVNVEFLIGHNLGLARSYYKPIERDVLADYLKAVELLTINDNDKTTLKKQVAELAEKSREEDYVIKGKLAEKEKEIEAAAREAEQTKKMLEEIRLQQEIQKAEREIDQANHENLARFVMGLEKSVIINAYDEKDGTQGLLKLGAKLRTEREAREKKHQKWHSSRERDKKLAKTM
jgi:hypothetical protein